MTMNMKPTLFAALALVCGAAWAETPQTAAAAIQHQGGKIASPDSGALARQIKTQQILENLNDQVAETARLEPDLPYTVQEGGLRLPQPAEFGSRQKARTEDQ
jgi:hypothetical protein